MSDRMTNNQAIKVAPITGVAASATAKNTTSATPVTP